MKYGLRDEQLTVIVETIKTFARIERAVIFGSRARGDYKSTSDIDIAIYGRDLTSTEVNLLRDNLEQLDIIYKFDVVDVYKLTKQKLVENIEQEGIEIYKCENW